MTKMIIKIWMLIALLLMATAAGAQNVINLKSHPHWECEYELDTKVSFSGANAVETGDMKGPELSYRVYEADLNPGGTLNIKTVSQCLTRGDHKAAKYKAEISLQFFKEDTSSPLGKRIINGGGNKTADSKVLSISCKVPKEADIAKVTVSVDGPMARVGTILHLTYKRPGMRCGQSSSKGNSSSSSSKTQNKERWLPPSSSNCKHPDSGIRFEELWGEVSFRCNDQDDDAYEFAEYQTVIKELDRIRTEEDSGAKLDVPEWQGCFTIGSESTILIHTKEPRVPSKLEILAGGIWANIKKMAEGKSIELEMSHCVTGIKGTIVAFEERNGKSNVYLFAGSVEVTSKKGKKKVMLKAGQASSVGKDGQVKVQKFDIEKGAKKFGIPMKEIKNYYSNKPSASSSATQKRYGMERGVITYSFAKGNQKGTVVRTFDKYGQLERQASKVSGSSTTNVTIYRGSKGYQLDEKTKKVKQGKYTPINFLNISDADLKKHKLTKKGTATVAGKQCTVYQSSTTTYYVWNGITLKKIVNSKNGKSVSEATKIEQPASIDENKFKVPQGYSVK